MIRFTRISAVVATVAALSLPVFAQMAEPHNAAAKQAAPDHSAAKGSANIIDATKKTGQFNTFNAAVEAAGLVETLKGPGPFTVFAPTDEAFKLVPKAKLDELLKPENKSKLQDVLKAHVVSGRVMAAEASKLDSAKPLAGSDLTIDATGGTVKIGEATVVQPDMAASNGVIHGVDKLVIAVE